MNGKKLYEVMVQETVTKIYAVTAEDEAEASIIYEDGEIVSEKVDNFEMQDVTEVDAE